jgi:Lipocalin-like domain
MSAELLIGNWKLVSWQVVTEDGAKDLFGANPKGYFIITREGRAMTVTTAESRRPGETDAERAALQKSMLAYTGKYRIEGNEFIKTVDASWNEGWNGTEQRRRFRFEGDKLLIESAPAPSITSPGKVDFRRIVWERDR